MHYANSNKAAQRNGTVVGINKFGYDRFDSNRHRYRPARYKRVNGPIARFCSRNMFVTSYRPRTRLVSSAAIRTEDKARLA